MKIQNEVQKTFDSLNKTAQQSMSDVFSTLFASKSSQMLDNNVLMSLSKRQEQSIRQPDRMTRNEPIVANRERIATFDNLRQPIVKRELAINSNPQDFSLGSEKTSSDSFNKTESNSPGKQTSTSTSNKVDNSVDKEENDVKKNDKTGNILELLMNLSAVLSEVDTSEPLSEVKVSVDNLIVALKELNPEADIHELSQKLVNLDHDEFSKLIDSLKEGLQVSSSDGVKADEKLESIAKLLNDLNGTVERVKSQKPETHTELKLTDANADQEVQLNVSNIQNADKNLNSDSKSANGEHAELKVEHTEHKSELKPNAHANFENIKENEHLGMNDIKNIKSQTQFADIKSIYNQIKNQMARSNFNVNEHGEMLIKLKPEELGKVELKLEIKNDVLIAKFDVESSIVKQAIESNLSDLKSALKDKGYNDLSLNVFVNDNGNDEANQSFRSFAGGKKYKVNDEVQAVTAQNTQMGGYDRSLSYLTDESTFEHLA